MRGYVLSGACVVDLIAPEGAFRDVTLCDGRITERPSGRERVIDASGCLALPGFIDVHAHLAPSWGGRYGPAMALQAGATFVLDVTGPTVEVRELLRRSGARLRVGVCEAVRKETVGRSMRGARAAVETALAAGALGVKILGGHLPLTPIATRHIIAACTERGCLCVVHVGTTRTYSDIEGLAEALGLADGMPVHIAHVNGYCRGYVKSPLEEAITCLRLLQSHPNATSDSYIFRWNALPLAQKNGCLDSHATRFWLERLGYPSDFEGVAAAWADGKARLVVPERGEHIFLAYGDAGPTPERRLKRARYLSLPVNSVEAAIGLSATRREDGKFVVDCLSTDGGGIPRNVMARVAWGLVQLGVWSWADAIAKTAVEPARILKLPPRGEIGPGATGDLTLIDAERGTVIGCFVGGRPAFWRGRRWRAHSSETDVLFARFSSRPPTTGLRP